LRISGTLRGSLRERGLLVDRDRDRRSQLCTVRAHRDAAHGEALIQGALAPPPSAFAAAGDHDGGEDGYAHEGEYSQDNAGNGAPREGAMGFLVVGSDGRGSHDRTPPQQVVEGVVRGVEAAAAAIKVAATERWEELEGNMIREATGF
jgi:hypothetical protein